MSRRVTEAVVGATQLAPPYGRRLAAIPSPGHHPYTARPYGARYCIQLAPTGLAICTYNDVTQNLRQMT